MIFVSNRLKTAKNVKNCGLTHENYEIHPSYLLPGTNLLGKYILGCALRKDDLGITYIAYSAMLHKAVVIKEYCPFGIADRIRNSEKISVFSPEREDTNPSCYYDNLKVVFKEGEKCFVDEANIISQFNTNKNIISIYECFSANDTVYYSMEYLKGTTLGEYIKQKGGKLSEDESLRIMKAVCDALAAVHSVQILHMDISPDSIFVCNNGDAKLIDFGAVKQIVKKNRIKWICLYFLEYLLRWNKPHHVKKWGLE